MSRLKRLKRQQDIKRGRKDKAAGPGCLTAFGVIWLLMILVFDVILIKGVVELAIAKASFQPIDAIVIRAQVEFQNTSDGTTYTPDIEYTYTVNGQQYTSDRHSFFEISSSSRDFAQKIVDRYPINSQIIAHYNPSDPSKAVVEMDDSSFPYFAILFLTPFHCIGIGLVFAGVSMSRRKQRDPHHAKIAGYVIRRRGRTVVLHDAFWPRWLVLCVLFGATNFVAIFAGMLTFGFTAPGSTIISVWLGCFAIAWFVTQYKDLKRTRSDNRLTINWKEGSFVRGKSNTPVPIASIVKIKLRSKDTKAEINHEQWYTHTIEAIDLHDQTHLLLVGKGQGHRGKEIRSWFEIEFGLKEPDDQSSSSHLRA
jgi:hypothetical protein